MDNTIPIVDREAQYEHAIDKLLAAVGFAEPVEEEVKQSESCKKVSIKEVKKTMETKNTNTKVAPKADKKPFVKHIDGDTYTVERGYLGSDNRIHIAPSNTFPIFVKTTADGKRYAFAEVKHDGSSWTSQLFENLAKNASKHPASQEKK